MSHKTLIGKNNVLFLINDGCDEFGVHCNNINKVRDPTLQRYSFNNFILFVFPNKSLIYKDLLPDEYIVQYRPALEIYKSVLKDKVHDLYQILKNENDVYYKTDTHINVKGNYIVYKYFVNTINSRLNANIIAKELVINVMSCVLNKLPYGIGDLTWKSNLGNQILRDTTDNFYFNDECAWFYNVYAIRNDNNIKFLNFENLSDNTELLENKVVDWNIISKYIINVRNNDALPMKIIIFYDSFLLSVLPLYFDMFNDGYFVKSVYSNDLINAIKPDYVFEFRVERFLF